jgi:hypothetical protein
MFENPTRRDERIWRKATWVVCMETGKVKLSLNLINEALCHEVAGHGSRAVACFLFARSEAGTVGSNPTQGMDV